MKAHSLLGSILASLCAWELPYAQPRENKRQLHFSYYFDRFGTRGEIFVGTGFSYLWPLLAPSVCTIACHSCHSIGTPHYPCRGFKGIPTTEQ